MTLSRPGYGVGFARNASQSVAPEQWLGLQGAWAPFLGYQGLVLYDISGYGRHAALTNIAVATSWVQTARGMGVDFDGTNDHGVIAATNIIAPEDWTIMLWAHSQLIDGTERVMFVLGDDASGGGISGFTFVQRPTSGFPRITVVTGTDAETTLDGPTALPLNTWIHLAATKLGTAVTLYANGVQIGTATSPTATMDWTGDTPVTRIGASSSGGDAFSGFLDDIRLYDRPLMAAEILNIYANSFAMYQLQRRQVLAVAAAAAVLIAQERSIMRHVPGRVFGRVN